MPGDSSPAVLTATSDANEWFCPNCGYDLRGTDSARCPECGLVVDRSGPPPARIPWEQRRNVGRLSAWGRTVLLATFAPNRLAGEVRRRVRYADALRFRLVTSTIAGLTLGAVLLGGVLTFGAAGFFNTELQFTPDSFDPGMASRLPAAADLRIPWEAGISCPPVQPLAAVLFMVLASGAATYFLHPRGLDVERQNAAVALGHYAGAPFLFLPITLACCAAAKTLDVSPRRGLAPLFIVLSIVGSALNVWTMLKAPLTLIRQAARGGAARVIAAAVLLPVMWGIAGLVAFAAFPWMVGFVRLAVGSLR